MLWRDMVVFVSVFLLLATPASARLSKEEVDSLWEQLLRDERYEAIGFYGHDPNPSIYRYTDKTIRVHEARKGYLGGLFGSGGGWEVIGDLEAEVSTDRGILQVYSKQTKKWAPGFGVLWEPTYDNEKYPMWEFRLIVRDPSRRQDLRLLKSVFFSPKDVLRRTNPDGNPIKE